MANNTETKQLTCRISTTEGEEFEALAAKYGYDSSYKFLTFIVTEFISGRVMTAGKMEETQNLTKENEFLKAELQKSKEVLPKLFYEKGYNECKAEFIRKQASTKLKIDFFDENIKDKNDKCGWSGGCLFGQAITKERIKVIKIIESNEK